MASCNRALAIKAVLLAFFVLILLNLLLSSKWDATDLNFPRMSATQWPKRTHTSADKNLQQHLHGPKHTTSSSSNNGHDQEAQPGIAPAAIHGAAGGNGNKRTNETTQQTIKYQKYTLPTTNRSVGGDSRAPALNRPASDRNGTISQHNNDITLADTPQKQPNVIRNLEQNLTNRTVIDGLFPATTNGNPSKSSNSTSVVSSISSNSSGSTGTDSLQENQKLALSSNGTSGDIEDHHPVPELYNVPARDEESLFDSLLKKFGANSCPPIPPNLDGPIEVDESYEPLEAVVQRYGTVLEAGGQYTPKECTARDRVAIIVPYRDREHHLPIFLKNLHPFLMKQQIEYGFYLVEQSAGGLFNRAALMNIGFVEAMKQKNWDCMVFHDVDLLPMDDRNLYTCPDQPRHMSVAVDTFCFKLPYSTIFGGVSAMTAKQFRLVNGFSNSFWGWGGEDDDMSNRLKHVGFHIARYPVNIARYTMLSHKKEKANPKRYEKLVNGAKRFDSDGLNSLHYQLINLIRKPLYTWVHVEITQDSS